jgi:hypothetical protein
MVVSVGTVLAAGTLEYIWALAFYHKEMDLHELTI